MPAAGTASVLCNAIDTSFWMEPVVRLIVTGGLLLFDLFVRCISFEQDRGVQEFAISREFYSYRVIYVNIIF